MNPASHTVNRKILDKFPYGGMLVDKYFFKLEGLEYDCQVRAEDYCKYEIGDIYPNLEPKEN